MNEQNWFYIKNEQQCGPVSRDEIIRLLAQGELTQDTSVWAEGMENWQPISQTPDFAALRPAGLPVQRPTSVTVLGILNIIFGSLGFLCAPLAFFSLLTNPPADPFEIGQRMKIFGVVGQILGLIFSAVLLASGIGLLKQKQWAPRAAILYAWAMIIWLCLSIIINAVWLTSFLKEIPQEAEPAVIAGMIGGMVGGMCGGLIYPIILLIFLRKPHVIEACSQYI